MLTMKPLAIVGSLIGGILGAVAWGAITAATKLEIGYVATGVGFLVGYGSALFGGRGKVNGVVCAMIALLAMFGGKIVTVRFLAPSEIRKALAAEPGAQNATAAQLDEATDRAVASLDFSTTVEMAKDTLDVIDIVFAVIGVAAAFQIGDRGTYRKPTPTTGYSSTAPGGPGALSPYPAPPGPPAPPATDEQAPPAPPPPSNPQAPGSGS